jgi:hypothetical protein
MSCLFICKPYRVCRLGVLLVIGTLWVQLMGCGYTTVGNAMSQTGKSVTLTIPAVLNRTREPGLESRLTGALRQTIVQHQRLRLADASEATYALQSMALRFRLFAIALDSRDRVVQYRIEVDTRVRLVQPHAERPVLDQEITAWAEYLLSPTGSVRENVVARTTAMMQLAQRFAVKTATLLEIVLL